VPLVEPVHKLEHHTSHPVGGVVDELSKPGFLSNSVEESVISTTDVSSTNIYMAADASTPNESSGFVLLAV
jgi:hypothetical protein